MSYQFPVDPHDLFTERTAQFVNLGLPKADLDQVRERVIDMWADAPGGWTYEWSRLASRYAESGDPYRASLAYGGARFPCLADEARRPPCDARWSSTRWRPTPSVSTSSDGG